MLPTSNALPAASALPIALGAKQKLMELDDPLVRLQLVHDYLCGQGVVKA